jgi:3-hydroxyacyl-CoA dehydrogenase
VPGYKIDQIKRRFGMQMGPLALLDLVGLDVAAHIARSVSPAFGDRLKPHPALELMCQAGWLGQKTGLGFYRYQGKKKTVHTEALAKLRGQMSESGDHLAAELAPRGLTPDLDSARERMVCLMVNEGAAALAEGLAASADVIDLAMVLGTGWAPHRGGPLRYADDRAAREIVKVLEGLTQKLGPRFEPCPELRNRSASGELFYANLMEALNRESK